MEHINVVISGFDPYEDVTINPAFEVPKALQEQGIWDDSQDSTNLSQDVEVNVHAVNIPVSFAKAWPLLRETLEATKPDIVIATGLKHSARSVMLERCATNLMDAAKPDADNATPRRMPIDEHGPAAYWTRLPLRAILRYFAKQGIPSSLSSDAGTYVCNSLFYSLLHWTVNRENVLAGFVSFPPINDDPHAERGLSLDQQIKAGQAVVRKAVWYYLHPSSGNILLDEARD